MPKHRRHKEWLISLKVGFFLALRDIKRASRWTTGLIIAVMVLTFLNLVVVSGILVGLIQGSVDAQRGRYTGDVVVSLLNEKNYIEQSQSIIALIKSLPEVELLSARYVADGRVEANYKRRLRSTDKVDQAGGSIVGIDPLIENKLTGLSKYVVEGEYLLPNDYDKILLGATMLYKYTPIDSAAFPLLKDVEIGDKVRVVVEGVTREVVVKGILKSKEDEIDRAVFMVDSQLRGLIGRGDYNVDNISIRLKAGTDPNAVKDYLLRSGVGEFARVQTFEDAQPKFLKDIQATFALLGNMIGSIGLAVASITIFIVIFVNAITRRRFIGIMKGIGISSMAIEFSYMVQSLFYALSGMIIGSFIVFVILQPFIAAHPINFPFSDGILVATPLGTFARAAILFAATIIAGYIPARIVVKQNTLDAILGR